jgi:tRNA nucleotidyltransferase (CCA-adding enzyme)
MPDYMYLLESRLSPEQRAVLERVQELSRSQDVNVYLTGGAVRDLISGQPIRDLDFTVEGNPVRMVHELEKGGARVGWESGRLRHHEMTFAGDVDGSISAARDDYYERPGAKPEYRFAGVMEDLRRRDFSINAIAISLNSQSRGLLLDPTNGLADLEKQEVRALSIHAFTNQPIRILRILRYCARMGFKMEGRTQEWFDLAMERGLHKNFEGVDVGHEVRSLAREDIPAATLKQWESRGLLEGIHPQLQRRKPDYDSLNKLTRVRANLLAVSIRPRLQLPVTYYILSRLKSREGAAAMRHMEFRSAEVDAIGNLVPEAQKIVKILKGRKTNSPLDAYVYVSSLPPEMLAFIEVEVPNPRALSKIRSYVQKWRPLRQALPVAELDALGVPRGPKFDKILEQLFEMQIRGRGRNPEDRTKILRKLAGIKEEPKKAPEKEKKKRKEKEPVLVGQHGKPATPAPVSPGGQPGKPAPGALPAHALHGKPGKTAPPAAGQHGKPTPGASHPPGSGSVAASKAPSSAAAAIGAKAQAKHEKAAAAHKATKKSAAPSSHKAKPGRAKKSRR